MGRMGVASSVTADQVMGRGGRSGVRRITSMALRSAAALLLALAALVAAGCGAKQNDLAPAACLASNEGYLRALEAAPAQVRLAGSTPISDCLVPEQDAGQLANIGHEMVVAATKLNGRA